MNIHPEDVKPGDLIEQDGECLLVLAIFQQSHSKKLAFHYICLNDDEIYIDWMYLGQELCPALQGDGALDKWTKVDLKKIA